MLQVPSDISSGMAGMDEAAGGNEINQDKTYIQRGGLS
jgi:hypothetical protein